MLNFLVAIYETVHTLPIIVGVWCNYNNNVSQGEKKGYYYNPMFRIYNYK